MPPLRTIITHSYTLLTNTTPPKYLITCSIKMSSPSNFQEHVSRTDSIPHFKELHSLEKSRFHYDKISFKLSALRPIAASGSIDHLLIVINIKLLLFLSLQ